MLDLVPAVRVVDLNYTYRKGLSNEHALTEINLEIGQGEFLCLIGHSGCGKSTLLNVIGGLLPEHEGRVEIMGEPLRGAGTDRALVFQHYSLFPWLTALNNVSFGVRRAQPHLSRSAVREIALKYLDKVDLSRDLNKYPYQLSGGMQQRVAIARALAMDSPILLLDEPFGALDAKLRGELQELLSELWQKEERAKTVLFITHDINEALLLGTRVAFMREGQITHMMGVPFAFPRRAESLIQESDFIELRQHLLVFFVRSRAM